MSETVRADLCVVGAGLAGMAAAVRASELGARVIVLEQSAATAYLCNSRMTNGMFHLALADVLSGADALEAAVHRATRGAAHPQLARALATDAPRGVRWLQSQGVRFFRASPERHHNFTLAPPATHRSGPYDILGRGGDVMLRRLEAALGRNGGGIRRGWRARELRAVGGRCMGVRGEHDSGLFDVAASAVVIADGGFQADADLLRRFGISPAPGRMVQRNARSGRGDGLRMAEAAGARLTDMLGFYGHVQSRDALRSDALWPYPWLDIVAGAGIVVGPDGRRFADEGRGGVYLANRLAALPDPASAFVILDQRIWDGPGRAYLKAPNPRLTDAGGSLIAADTPDALADRIRVPADVLSGEVRRYNAAVHSGECDHLLPERTTSGRAPWIIATAPFYAIPVAPGITHTMGGIAIDEWSRARRSDGSVFDGLYAAGSCTGGVEGGEHAGYVGGLVKALVTGLRAAEHFRRA